MEALRQRKALDPARLTGANHPSTAFLIMGHGQETPNIKVVPEGSIIVVQVHSGEVNYISPDFFPGIMNDSYKEDWLDPVTNYKYIVDTINSLRGYYTPFAIYREGDEYPDFLYTLLSSWDNDNDEYLLDDYDTYSLEHSGIAKYPFTKGQDQDGIQQAISDVVHKDTTEKEVFLNLYDKSEYPSRDEIEEIVDRIPEPKTIETIIYSSHNNESPSELFTKLHVRQSELFAKLGPGVYYNLVCRATRDSIRVKNVSSGKNVINDNQRSLVNSGGHIIRNMPEIESQIVEAEAHRKDLVEKLNLNSHPRNLRGNNVEPIINTIRNLKTNPNEEVNIGDIADYIISLEADPTQYNMFIKHTLFSSYYPLLKEYFIRKIRMLANPRELEFTARLVGKEKAEEDQYKTIKLYRQLLNNLESFQLDSEVARQVLLAGFREERKADTARQLVKEAIARRNFTPERKEQMAKQRVAHAIALNKAAQNEADFQMAALYQGLNQPAVPVQLVENNLVNINGFKQRQELAERQAQEAVAKWKRKAPAGGKRTRRIKKKNKAKKSRLFSKKRR